MSERKRNLMLDVFDYGGNKICSQYDSTVDASGQASQIFVTTERNGWKELSFQIPSVYEENGEMVDNFRIDYLKADYRIRQIDDEGTDWYIVSEPRIMHQAYSKNMSVTAGHVSQILKTKNLGLEFSDEEGNNIGTALELLTRILEGTGWSVGDVAFFYEKDGVTEKRRSLKEAAKSGAFKLISSMCDLFDAKPVFHGDSKTVDIYPMNPFTVSEETGLPTIADTEKLYDGGVIELAYSKNVKSLNRTLNTENLVTKLYAYGSYGDETDGYCGIEECDHVEHIFVPKIQLEKGSVYWFSVVADNGLTVCRHFSPSQNVAIGTKIVWSTIDPASTSYVWDESSQHAYLVGDGKNREEQEGVSFDDWCGAYTKKKEQNWFSFLMDFSYYQKVGLLTDDMLQKIAAYQRNAKDQLIATHDAAEAFSDALTKLSETIGSVNFCKIDVEKVTNDGEYVKLELNDEYPNGVVYRTDYLAKPSDYFEWRTADAINTKGDPTNSVASVIYVIHNTTPVTWEKVYIKNLDSEDNVGAITQWNGKNTIAQSANDEYFVFESNNVNGWLGAQEISDEANVQAQNSATKVVTATHPVYYAENTPQITDEIKRGYGWWWKYEAGCTPDCNASELYFCHYLSGDTTWKKVLFQKNEPSVVNGYYWFDWHSAKLYKGVSGSWQEVTDESCKKAAKMFGTVYRSSRSRDQLYQGVFQEYEYTATKALSAGNYYIQSDFDTKWVFTTKEALNVGDKQTYNTDDAWVIQTKDGVESSIEAKGYRFDNVMYDENDDSIIVIEKENFSPQTNIVRKGDLKGILHYMEKWPEYADSAYLTHYENYKTEEQKLKDLEMDMVSALGDLYREGWWQSDDYVDGDEDKLYDDALENLKRISQPEATYEVSFIDQWSAETMSDSDIVADTDWNDLTITTAAHVIDPEIDVNVWAYIDKLKKCYDVPSKTTLTINTNLSKMSLHSFTDVMTNIANVASEVRSMSSVYGRATAITSGGKMAAERLQGSIDAAKLKIFGGASTWYTDEAGNIIFVSADGSSAMTLTGNGFAIANSKDEWGEWNWRTFGTGDGFTADEIVAGYLSAERLEVGSIGAEKLTESVRTQLEEGTGYGERITEVETRFNPDSIVSTVRSTAQYWADLAAAQGLTTYMTEEAPTENLAEGDIWIPPSGSSEAHYWDGTKWVKKDVADLIQENGSEIKQSSDKIEMVVSDVEKLSETVDSNSSSITQMANEIELQVKSITEQEETVEVHETTITQNTNKINLQAESLTEIETRLDEAELTISPEGIMGVVRSSEDFQKALDSGKTFIQYRVPSTDNVGDQWVKTAPENITWENLSAVTWEEAKSEYLWGELTIIDRPITYAWTGKEWKKISDLQEVDEVRSSIEQRADSIELRVEEMANTPPDKLQNSAVIINTSGVAVTGKNISLDGGSVDVTGGGNVDVSGGNVNISAGGNVIVDGGGNVDVTGGNVNLSGGNVSVSGGNVEVKSNGGLTVESGGTVKISAGDSEGSVISFGEAFSVSKNGVSAATGSFDSLDVGGKAVLTSDNLAGKIVISASQPSGKGIIWLKPASAASVDYSAYTGANRNKFLKDTTQTLELACNSADSQPNSTFKYTISFPVMLIMDGSSEKNVTQKVVATKASNSSLKVTFPTYTQASISEWQTKNIELTVESSTNLCADTGVINVAITGGNLVSNYLCIKNDAYITFTAADLNSSGSVQACSIYYIP